jgi:hypothetical protein
MYLQKGNGNGKPGAVCIATSSHSHTRAHACMHAVPRTPSGTVNGFKFLYSCSKVFMLATIECRANTCARVHGVARAAARLPAWRRTYILYDRVHASINTWCIYNAHDCTMSSSVHACALHEARNMLCFAAHARLCPLLLFIISCCTRLAGRGRGRAWSQRHRRPRFIIIHTTRRRGTAALGPTPWSRRCRPAD